MRILPRLKAEIGLPLNFEMASTAENATSYASRLRRTAVASYRKNRNERTTEGGLDVAGQHKFSLRHLFAS